jgi:carbon monoxide dehydrogenase subunit G
MTISRRMDAAPEAVFAVMSDLANAAETISGIKKMEMLTDGPVGVGTRFRETRVMMGKEATEEMEVTAFEAGRSYTLECDSCGCHYRTEVRVKPDGTGTLAEMELDTRAVSLLAKLMTPMEVLMRGTMRKHLEKDLDDVKRVVEGE